MLLITVAEIVLHLNGFITTVRLTVHINDKK